MPRAHAGVEDGGRFDNHLWGMWLNLVTLVGVAGFEPTTP